MSYLTRGIWALTLCVGATVMAQDAQTPVVPNPLVQNPANSEPILQPNPPTDHTLYANQPYESLDLGHKYLYSVTQMFGGPHLLAITAHAAFDQGMVKPLQWGSEGDAYWLRLASSFGRGFVKENIAFGVRALDHEDPRYFNSGLHDPWKRTKYAISRTFIARKDDGTWMPAYSRFLADYSMPFIAQQWRPGPTLGWREARSGTVALGVGAAVNIGEEFWPDVKKKLHLRTHLGPIQ